MDFDVKSQRACRYDRRYLQPVATMQTKLNAGTLELDSFPRTPVLVSPLQRKFKLHSLKSPAFQVILAPIALVLVVLA